MPQERRARSCVSGPVRHDRRMDPGETLSSHDDRSRDGAGGRAPDGGFGGSCGAGPCGGDVDRFGGSSARRARGDTGRSRDRGGQASGQAPRGSGTPIRHCRGHGHDQRPGVPHRGAAVRGLAAGRAAEPWHGQFHPDRRFRPAHDLAPLSRTADPAGPAPGRRGGRDRAHPGMPGLPRFVPMSARRWASVTALMRAPAWAPADTTRCVWSDYQGSWEKVTPIGQAHVAANAGITVDYELNYTDNLYVNFGGASASNGPFSGVGNITLSENFGISGGATFGGTSAGLRNYLGSQYL